MKKKVIEILTSASKNIPQQASKPETKVQDSRAQIFENNDDFEVFEVEE